MRGQINSEKTFPKELSCKNSNYIEINNQLDCFGSKESHNDDTNSVILSGSETIQPIVNQKQFQGKIDSSPESSCPPLVGGPKSMISRRGKINCHVEGNGNLSLNNFVEDIPLTCTPKVRFSSLRTASSPRWGEEFLVAKSNNSRKVAFTLAEVLITLGIIGVVVAMTIPTLIKNYQKQVTVTKLQKAYSVLNHAFKQSEADNEPSEFWDDPFVIRSQAYFEKYYKPYLNGAKQCFSYQECGYTERCPYKYLNNDESPFVTSMDRASLKNDRFAFYLPDGTFYWFLVSSTGSGGQSVPNNTLFIDINGGQAPNIVSKDVFIFERVAGKGILPYGYKYSKSIVNSNCLTSGHYCATKIMQEGWKITYPY